MAENPVARREPVLSLVIPVYNGQATVGRCLEGVFASTLTNIEVIVVDDHSTDGTVEVVRRFPCRLVETVVNAGAGAARNLGASSATAPVIYFLDADILLQPDTLSRMLASFELRPHVSAVFGSFEKNAGCQNFASVYKNLQHHYTHQTGNEDATTFCGGFSAIRREVFLKVGGFDPAYRTMEDVELGYRLHLAGYRVWLRKDLQVLHMKPLSLRSLVRADIFDRAVPWTVIMWEKKIFRNDLNTRTHNVASVPLSFLILASFALPLPWLWLCFPLALVFVVLNRRFLDFVRRERGGWFAARAGVFCWFAYLYSAAGALWGTIKFGLRAVRNRRVARVGASSCND